jgi:hypothetical protein
MNPEAATEREQKFLEKRNFFFRQAVKAGKGNIYTYGFQSLNRKAEQFFKEGKHLVQPCSRGYEVNPFMYQYDLEVELFLNYDQIIKDELEYLDDKLSKCNTKNKEEVERREFNIEMVQKFGTGIDRQEHFWNASNIRWPIEVKNKEEHGAFIREPWAEDFIDALCDYPYVICFGGSGQGKTHRALAFMCIGWDHYIDSHRGGRGIISTVAESKLQGSAWAYLQMIYKETVGSIYNEDKPEPISLYAGRGIISGEYTIRRPNDKKGGGTIKGLLISNRNDNSVTDKITGSHGHPFGMYHIDELQSTPDAPIKASPNFRQNCKHSWITASGNYDLETDSLGKNTQPVRGWDNVNESTHIYESINTLGIRTCCIHYNNELSPAITSKEGLRRWGHILPTEAKRDNSYPTASSKLTDEFRRLWIGWRKKKDMSDSVLNKQMLTSMGCDENITFDPKFPVTHGWSLDSATGNLDRNLLTHFADGVCSKTGMWRVHIFESVALPKSEDRLKYVRETSDSILSYSEKWGVRSGNAVMDWTNVTGIPEYLADRGFKVMTMGYGEAPPDGKTKNPRTNRVDDEIVVDYDSDKKAHEVVTNLISLGAYVIQQMVLHGEITGFTPDLVNEGNSEHSFDEEICLRKFLKVPHIRYDERYQLEPKTTKGRKSSDRGIKGFREMYGFSPDILDTIFQIGYYMVKHRKFIPGMRNRTEVKYNKPKENIKIEETPIHKHAEIWEDDLIETY